MELSEVEHDQVPAPCAGCPLQQRCGRYRMTCAAFRLYSNLRLWTEDSIRKELKPLTA